MEYICYTNNRVIVGLNRYIYNEAMVEGFRRYVFDSPMIMFVHTGLFTLNGEGSIWPLVSMIVVLLAIVVGGVIVIRRRRASRPLAAKP